MPATQTALVVRSCASHTITTSGVHAIIKRDRQHPAQGTTVLRCTLSDPRVVREEAALRTHRPLKPPSTPQIKTLLDMVRKVNAVCDTYGPGLRRLDEYGDVVDTWIVEGARQAASETNAAIGQFLLRRAQVRSESVSFTATPNCGATPEWYYRRLCAKYHLVLTHVARLYHGEANMPVTARSALAESVCLRSTGSDTLAAFVAA